MVKSLPRHSEIINPLFNFAKASKTAVEYLLWNASPSALQSRKNLLQAKFAYEGRKAIIICNGPSLLRSDLTIIPNDVFTFGLNKINLLFDKTSFRPSCIVSVNKYVIEQNKHYFRSSPLPLFLDSKAALANRIKASNHRTLLFSSNSEPGFSTDPTYAIAQGSTVTFVAMQLAFYLGFRHVALIGCDHYFNSQGQDHKLTNATKIDHDHFDPTYFSNGMKWQLPSLLGSEESYIRAQRIYLKYNRNIYNCTEGGSLTLFKRLSLEKFLSI